MHFPIYPALGWFEATHMPSMQSIATLQSRIMVLVGSNRHDFEATTGILCIWRGEKFEIVKKRTDSIEVIT